MTRPSVGAVLRQFLPPFLARFSVPSRVVDTFKRLSRCHTGQLGWSLMQCEGCSLLQWTPNGCGDRHCPDCSTRQRELWLKKQRADLLPVRYYHWVFTLPACLRPLALQNQKLLYTLLFEAAAKTLLEFGQGEFNVQIGLTALLHTWGQNLMNHPHLHCLVTGGGLSPEGTWAGPKQSRFLFPIHALGVMFAGKFIGGLEQLRTQGKLQFHGKIKHLENLTAWVCFIQSLRQRKWVVFAKGSVLGPDALLEYLGRYTHRVAITNSRILSATTEEVTFRCKNYRKDGQAEDLTLAGVEFVRRLSLHVLPPGFTKVRHYGLLGNNQRKKSIPVARSALKDSPHRVDLSPPAKPKPPAWEPTPCNHCGCVDRRCVGRTNSQGQFTGQGQGAVNLHLRVGSPPTVLNSS